MSEEIKKIEELKEKNRGLRLVSMKDFTNLDFTKSNNFLTSFYSNLQLNEKRIINSLLYIFSSYSKITKKEELKRRFFKEIFLKEKYFEMNFQKLLEIMKIKHNEITLKEFENHLDNIRQYIFKYIKTVENSTVRTSTSFIQKYQIIKKNDLFDNEIMKETSIRIFFDKELFDDIFNFTSVGYTTLNININKIKSNVGMGLYEELKRITNLKQIKKKNEDTIISNKYKQNHSYTLEELNTLFGSNYKYLSKLLPNLEIQHKKLLKMNLIEDIYKFHIIDKKLEIEIVRHQYEDEQIF